MDPREEGDVRIAPELAEYLRARQPHVYERLAAHPSLRRQVARLDTTTPGGLKAYCERAVRLLSPNASVERFRGQIPAQPTTGERLKSNTPRFEEAEEIGLREVVRCAFVVVAGGLGERLVGLANAANASHHNTEIEETGGDRKIKNGENKILPKISYPLELVTQTSFLAHHLEFISAYQERARYLTQDPNFSIPLVVMTSDDTHDAILAALNDRLPRDSAEELTEVTVMKQEKVPAFLNTRGELAMESRRGGGFEIVTKPHGHGDVHSLLHSTGVAAQWSRAGIEFIVLLQDTNALAYRCVLAALGESRRRSLDVNLVAIQRRPGEQIGAICEIEDESGTPRTCCIEYNELDPLLRARGGRGDVAAEVALGASVVPHPSAVDDVGPMTGTTSLGPAGLGNQGGFSPFPGNINVIVLNCRSYARALEASRGVVPEFANPKPEPSDPRRFRSPCRLECMMQDICLSFPARSVGYTEFERFLCFSPMKNNPVDALAKFNATGYAESASSAESDYYATGRRLLAMAGCGVRTTAIPIVRFAGGIPFEDGAKIVLKARFGVTVAEIRSRFVTPEYVEITPRSALVLDGDVVVHRLFLDGFLKITARNGARIVIKSLRVENLGLRLEHAERAEAEEALPPAEAMRGFRIVEEEYLEIVQLTPGETVIDR